MIHLPSMPYRFSGRAARRQLLVGVLLLMCGLAFAACGSSGDVSSGKGKGAVIVGLIEAKGDSSYALDDYTNGAELAVTAVNDKGGVLGGKLTYKRIPASVVDPQAARTAFLKGVDLHPAAMLGFPGGGSLEALTRDVDAAKLPLIHLSSDGKLAAGAPAGSDWLFSVNPNDTGRTDSAVKLAETMGAKTVGILATDETFGRDSTENSLKALKSAGIKVGPVRYVSPTATDLTSAVLEMRDVDVVLSWTFPNILAVQLDQMAQNGLHTPVITGNSGPLVAANKLVTGKALDNLHAVTPCVPSIGESEEGRSFAAAYKAKFGTDPTASATQSYDAVRLLAAAINAAGSNTDHDRIRKELSSLDMKDGACAAAYKSDGAHFLGHQIVAVDYGEDGSGKITATYDVPPSA